MKTRITLMVVLFFMTLHLHAQKILFVGNSLTYYNNLPEILEFIGDEFDIQMQTKSLCFPNYALEDHLNDGRLQKEILNRYNYIIVQQGPSSQDEGKQMLLRDGSIIRKLSNQQKAKLGFFMVWPSKRYYYTFDKVIENHQLAAKSTKSMLFPVGKLWKEYNQINEGESLYGPDGFHPSTSGSFFAALIIFHKLYPEKNLHQLTLNQLRQWIKDEGTLKTMIQLIKNQN